ncbi:haloacid dehalogenase type II [Actinomadura sp. 7K507]|uniref:haloacid dehalogenase type II n=1 Tax=Actinomadura sp. 7K507 TaxID=2530365 RepID=UPI00104F5AA3|nr:haloacid dehalogenase type II [Actinomadura sp. 7K507]TDC83193.1 haloacid dehalogenase type II [Actinomadura sp. 7K507]
MDSPIRLVVFDVNETLSDMSPLRARFEDVHAPGHLAATWFAGVLRDGFALTAAGGYADFRDVAEAGLRGLLADLPGWEGDATDAAAHILDGFADLGVHPDVPDGVRALHAAGLRLATLTNGSTAITERLLSRAGLTGCFTELLDVSAPRAWKPAAAAYRYATDSLAVDPAETLLVAVHPWDVDGARRAGLRAAWLRRGATAYPRVLTPPTRTAADLRELARDLVPAD